jgi:cysteinyl-tRNA synthetase
MNLYLTNTLTGQKEVFKPIRQNEIGVYSCGPTVYWNQHIGHMYAYAQWDAMLRTFRYLGYSTKWVMNITDVGHLTGDNLGDADIGEDKMEKGANREGLSVWQIANKYIAQFKDSMEKLNILPPDVLCRATEHIPEQIELIKKIEANGFAYHTDTGLVFDTGKFPSYADFARLKLDDQAAGSRVAVDPQKKKPWDFLLWITNQPKHIMQWESPWGRGFPGWHIECTAMSVKYLGERFDIHTGGKEHIPVHHTNEIAQAFGAFGHGTANYWLHNEWMLLDGEKISKSLGNSILVTDIVDKGYDPLSLRYLILTTHYKTGLNFSWQSLDAASTAYKKLKESVLILKTNSFSDSVSDEQFNKFKQEFEGCLADDLNFAKAIGLVWQIVRAADLNHVTKLALVLDFDKVLGLKLDEIEQEKIEIPENIKRLVSLRDEARASKDFTRSDTLRAEIESLGFEVKDTPEGTKVNKK